MRRNTLSSGSSSFTALNSAATVARRDFLLEGTGLPSKPGWRSSRLDRLTEWAGSKQPNRPIICEYESSGLWLWFKWRGTVLKMTKSSVLLCMGVSLLIDIYNKCYCNNNNPTVFLQSLAGLKKMWEYHLTLATFILTFFLSHAYGYWQKVYDTSRVIQGRINDICMLLAVGAQRSRRGVQHNTTATTGTGSTTIPSSQKEGYNEDAETLLKRCNRLIRMSHTFFWAATPTASNGLTDCEDFLTDAANCPLPVDDEHIGPLLLSPYGLKALVKSGQLTESEAEDLMATQLPPSQYAYIILVWVGLLVMDGIEEGLLRGGAGFTENFLRQMTTLRASMFDIDDFRAGRMPLVYVQLVQIMVDSLVMIAPFALYPELGTLSIPLVGLVTLFFRGLLTISKSFLDPFGVDGFTEQNIRVDVLVSELNFGAAKRWIQSGRVLPEGFTKQKQ